MSSFGPWSTRNPGACPWNSETGKVDDAGTCSETTVKSLESMISVLEETRTVPHKRCWSRLSIHLARVPTSGLGLVPIGNLLHGVHVAIGSLILLEEDRVLGFGPSLNQRLESLLVLEPLAEVRKGLGCLSSGLDSGNWSCNLGSRLGRRLPDRGGLCSDVLALSLAAFR